MNKTTIITAVTAVISTAGVAFAYDYLTDVRRTSENAFDNAEKTYMQAIASKKQYQLALEKAVQTEANAYDTYKSTRCTLAFVKLANKEVITDETKSLCGISESQGPDLSQ